MSCAGQLRDTYSVRMALVGWPGLAAPRIPGGFDESGFGFVLVDSLADKWGLRETVTGKAVWAELDIRGEPGPQAH